MTEDYQDWYGIEQEGRPAPTSFTHDSHPAPERSVPYCPGPGASFLPPVVAEPKEPINTRAGGVNVFDAITGAPSRITPVLPVYSAEEAKMFGLEPGTYTLRPDRIPASSMDDLTYQERKERPVATGFLDYFPDAILAVANLSRVANEQHNPGKPMAWDRSKSGDEADTLVRHLIQRGTIDTDGLRHSAKVAWRALALLQKELEAEGLATMSRGSVLSR